MPKPRTLELRFPSLGIVRRHALERSYSAVGYPSPWGVNVRLEDSLTNRLRGGSFTGQTASTVTAARQVYLVTEDGDNIVTEVNGGTADKITLGPQYDVAAGDGRVWVPDGDDAPASGTADCLYRDRLLRVSSNAIFVSRQGDTTDWNYGKDLQDVGRATIFQLSEAGETGDDVVALIPHKDSFLLGFTAAETWVLAGDPVTGTLRNVSREVGIIAARAFCKRDNTVYFLSARGLYSVGADGSGLKALSEDVIPAELIDVDDDDCVLDYRHADRSVSIHLTASPSWLFDTEREGFWAFDTSASESHLLIGPLRLGGPNQYGLIQTMTGIMAVGSGTVTWRIVSGSSAEQACDNAKAGITAALAGNAFDEYVDASGAWDAGRSNTEWPRLRAPWVVLWLSATADWAFESVNLEVVSQFGRIR